MKKFALAAALVAAIVCFALSAAGGPAPGGYPQLCTDVESLTAAENSAYVTCAEAKSGSSTTYPGYTRVQDGNGTNLADVWPFSAATGSTAVRGLGVVALPVYVTGATWARAAVGAGAVDAGTPRVTLASDDPAVTALQIMDDWDESDRAKVNPIAGQAGVAAGSGAIDALTQRVVLATDSPAVSTSAPGTFRIQDNDSTDQAVVQTPADNQSLGLGLDVNCTMMAKDGGTKSLARMDGTGAIEIVDTSTRPGEDAGRGGRWVLIKGHAEDDYGPFDDTDIDNTADDVLGPYDIGEYEACCVYLKNIDAGDAFTDADLIFGPDTSTMEFTTTAFTTACGTLAVGATCRYCWTDAEGAVKITVTGAAGPNQTSARAWMHCRM